MKIITAVCEALLLVVLFALFTVPFFFLNSMSAHTTGSSVIAQNNR